MIGPSEIRGEIGRIEEDEAIQAWIVVAMGNKEAATKARHGLRKRGVIYCTSL